MASALFFGVNLGHWRPVGGTKRKYFFSISDHFCKDWATLNSKHLVSLAHMNHSHRTGGP